ncbi:eukaryotic initiation factor 4E protein, putative [Acanthamoeba castellanii str. Neff]|uniref:Eukaryotic initiation factor 4E protein, putative n=1 Tax=Acanthamoeba castellanii (strain ATCC 30010 / Neff) TaxID=1257118 RepID=L8GFK0_ACACF|nr:eukaryotic initiation factor 4E protein, putative [Acanthamoeba castellanii str. Neff]ELR11503.1 eukaryotic initiation factor 4E protein, putative [Acanthamoeba castellanii str. Neff]
MTSFPPPGFENISRASAILFDNFDADEVFIGPGLSAEEYEASLQKLCTFGTVQDFWKCYNNLPPIEKLRFKSSFHLMKSGISPLWEDPKNANGGFWAMREVILALIGEQFEGSLGEGDEICGLTVSIRQHDDIIRIWNTNASANSSGLLGRLKEIIPKAELRSPFYKANREHTDFNKDFHDAKRDTN